MRDRAKPSKQKRAASVGATTVKTRKDKTTKGDVHHDPKHAFTSEEEQEEDDADEHDEGKLHGEEEGRRRRKLFKNVRPRAATPRAMGHHTVRFMMLGSTSPTAVDTTQNASTMKTATETTIAMRVEIASRASDLRQVAIAKNHLEFWAMEFAVRRVRAVLATRPRRHRQCMALASDCLASGVSERAAA